MLYPNGTTTRPTVSSPYGPRDASIGISTIHAGADLVGFTTIHAIAPGLVTFAGWMNNAAGNTIIIDHGNGVTSVYMHNAAHKVTRRTRVTAGQPIATMGATGNASGPCNHLEIRLYGKHTEPLKYIADRLPKPAATTTTTGDTMILNIQGKKGERRGGLYLVIGDQATFIGGRTRLKQGRYPMFTNETEIRRLQARIKGLR